MKNQEIKILAIVLILCVLVQISSLKAQYTFASPFTLTGTGGSLQFGTDGTLTLSGTGGGGFLWNPAMNSLNFGQNSSSGYNSLAFGLYATASGYESFAFGMFSTASGWLSRSCGGSNLASGACSSASGGYSSATGAYSTAVGKGITASGNYSSASGVYVNAASAGSFVIGVNNVGGGDPINWVPTDPLFEVGNGAILSEPDVPGHFYVGGTASDAFVVYKNGNAAVQGNFQVGGVVTVAAGGDIPMFSGTN